MQTYFKIFENVRGSDNENLSDVTIDLKDNGVKNAGGAELRVEKEK
jgi:hypothetical protein